VPLAYYSVSADRDFWAEHWGGHSTKELLDTARTSPLTELISRALPRDGTVLEAGCGLGQYVVLLRERGWRAAGVDWAVDALRTCRRLAQVPLAAMKLESLAIRDASLTAYVSLGVVEHDEAGPDGILAEAARVLKPGGRLVVCAWLEGEGVRSWEVRHLLLPICREGRLPSMGSRADYEHLASEAGFRLTDYQDISREVRRTWSICLARLVKSLISDSGIRRLALSQATQSRDFMLSLPRLILALRTGAMRYGIFQWEAA